MSSEQLPMFPVFEPRTRARPSDPHTSHDAAMSLDARFVRQSQAAILRVLREHGPLTDSALIDCYRASREQPAQSDSGIRSRRAELCEVGLVADTGRRARLPSGRLSIMWQVIE